MTTRTPSPRFSAVSLFSGCGGSDLGLKAAGVEVSWANDISATACSLYERVTGSAVIEHGDVAAIDEFKKADILAGCYPCQGYSQGGARDSERSLNYLYREFDRALRQIRPRAFIVENVDGMRFAQNRPLLTAQLTRYRTAGYRVWWKVLDARDYGVAQVRRRLFLVGIRSDEGRVFAFPAPTHGENGRPGMRPYRTQRDEIFGMQEAARETYNDEPFHWYYLSRNRRRAWDDQAACVVAHWRQVQLHPDSPPLVKLGPDSWTFSEGGLARRLSYLECAALQSFQAPGAFAVPGIRLRAKYEAIGNAVPPLLFGAVTKSLVATLEGKAGP